jgi:hypothetical protein
VLGSVLAVACTLLPPYMVRARVARIGEAG